MRSIANSISIASRIKNEPVVPMTMMKNYGERRERERMRIGFIGESDLLCVSLVMLLFSSCHCLSAYHGLNINPIHSDRLSSRQAKKNDREE